MGIIRMFSSSSGDNDRKDRGLIHFSSSSGDADVKRVLSSNNNVNIDAPLPNPDPRYFTLVDKDVINGFLILKIHYPNCTNHEGMKIMVYDKGVTYADILKNNNNEIDPHFGVNPEYISPIARFEPTERGWFMAVEFAKALH